MLRRVVGTMVRSPRIRQAQDAKHIQAHADFALAAAMLEIHDRILNGATPDEVREMYEGVQLRWREESLGECVVYSNEQMCAQVSELLQHLWDLDHGEVPLPGGVVEGADIGGIGDAGATPPSPSPSAHTAPEASAVERAKWVVGEERRAAEHLVREVLEKRCGFAPWIGPSQAPTPSHVAGLYVRGCAQPGTVLALFPGAMFEPSMRLRASDAGHLADPRKSRLLIPRFDGAVLDVHAYSPPTPNPFAVGHLARHPPPGISPNALRIQIDFPGPSHDASTPPFPPHLLPYVPNAFGAALSAAQALHGAAEDGIRAKGVALVATRQVFREEVFVDHRLDPDQPTPAWYAPIDPDADRRTWAAVGGGSRRMR